MQSLGRKLAIVADDLTGACDTACQFALYGLKPVVTHRPQDRPDDAELLVAITESRKDSPSAACQKVREVATALLRQGHVPFYKKIDSTLKGPWCAELDGMIKAVRPEIVVVAPAFPVWGRTTLNGIQCVQGRPISELRQHALAHETQGGEPADLVGTLRAQFGGRVVLIRRTALKGGSARVARAMKSARFRGSPFLVFDACEDDDLRVIALAGCRLDERILWVGSGGLARYLPLGWGLRHSSDSAPRLRTVQNVIVINGSLNPGNTGQLTLLAEKCEFPLLWIEDEDSDNSVQTQQRIDNLLRAPENRRQAVISVRLNKPIRSAAHLQKLQTALQSGASRCVEAWNPLGLVLVGGDTAMKLYQALGTAGIRIEGEVQPGVPCGSWIGGLLDGQPVVTKAGGFGQEDTLVRAVELLRGAQ